MTNAPEPPIAAAYRATRERITALVADRPDSVLNQTVPHTPEWTVHDLIAHVTGIVDDAMNGRMDGVATDPWTAAQVERGRSQSITEMLDRWTAQAPLFEGVIGNPEAPIVQALFDLVTHEHDLRFALGAPGARDSDAIEPAAMFLIDALGPRCLGAGLAPVGLVIDGHVVVAAEDGAPTLACGWFDALRALGSRRSRDQVLAMTWTGDPTRHLDTLTPFGFTAASLDEE